MNSRYVLATVVTTLIATFVAAFGASAGIDSTVTYHGRLVIDHATVTPGEAGENSVLRLRIINDGYDAEHLLDLKTSVSQRTRLVARIGDRDTATMESFAIRADDMLDLGSSHMWVELGPLVAPLKAGQSISVELVFLTTRVPIEVAVRGAEG